MLRKIILTIFLSGIAFSSLAANTNSLQLINMSNQYVVVNYNSVVNGQTTPNKMDIDPNQSLSTGVSIFPNPAPQYQVTAINYYTSTSPSKPITSCPVLNFGQTYAAVTITIGNEGSCSAVITPIGANK